MTQQAQGWKGILGIQKEAVLAVDPVVPAMKKVYFESASLSATRNLISSNVISGTRNPTAPSLGNIDVQGDISTELQAYIATLLEGVLGAPTTVGAASPYVHTFKAGGALLSYVIELGYVDIAQYFKYNGCKFSKMSLSTTPEGYQKVSFGVVGVKETIGVVTFDPAVTNLGKTSFTGFNASIKEGGVVIADVSKLDLSIENNLDTSSYVIGGAGTRGSLNEGAVKVSGSIDVLFKNTTLLTKAISGVESSLEVVYSIGDGLGTIGNESIAFKIPELIYSQKSPGISGPGGVLVSLSFEGYYANSAEASAFQVVLKSSQAIV
jgi:hypothetical protein